VIITTHRGHDVAQEFFETQLFIYDQTIFSWINSAFGWAIASFISGDSVSPNIFLPFTMGLEQ
jgi:hypothetical protein